MPTGLLDPQQISGRSQRMPGATCLRETSGRPTDRPTPTALYIVVEKILASDEMLPGDWPVEGTTGYGFLQPAQRTVRRSPRRSRDCGTLTCPVYRLARHLRQVLLRQQANDPRRLAFERAVRALAASWTGSPSSIAGRGISRGPSLHRACREVVACFPVYRTYIRPGTDGDRDRRPAASIISGLRIAKRRNPGDEPFVPSISSPSVLLLGRPRRAFRPRHRTHGGDFVLKFQQLTGPVTAKGWRTRPFIASIRWLRSTKSGATRPGPGASTEQFPSPVSERRRRWPQTMLGHRHARHQARRGHRRGSTCSRKSLSLGGRHAQSTFE